MVKKDANEFILRWSQQLGSMEHALVFLDPYVMQVEWTTVEALAKTHKVDLWILVPIGQAIARLLTNRQKPPKKWADALTKFFGTNEWEKFYEKKVIGTLFGDDEVTKKNADYKEITDFTVKRMKTIFAEVLEDPIVLKNSIEIPLYILCFAASNQSGAKTAIKIAKDIAGKFNNG